MRTKKPQTDVVDLDSSNFDAIVKDSSKDVLVEFYAPCEFVYLCLCVCVCVCVHMCALHTDHVHTCVYMCTSCTDNVCSVCVHNISNVVIPTPFYYHCCIHPVMNT